MNLAYGYQKYGSTSTLNDGDGGGSPLGVTNHTLSANTAIGGVTVSALVGWHKVTDGASSTGYSLSAFTPISGALSGGLIYSDSNMEGMPSQVGVSLKYDFSKATYAYFVHNSYSDTMAVTANSGPAGKRVSIIGLGTSF